MKKSLIIMLFSMIAIIHGERIVYYAQQREGTSSTYGVYRYIQDGSQIQKELLVSNGGHLKAVVQISDRYLFYVDINNAGVIDLKIKKKFQTWRNMGAKFFYDSHDHDVSNQEFGLTAVYEKGSDRVIVMYSRVGQMVYNLITQEVYKSHNMVPMSRIKGLQASRPNYRNRRFLQKLFNNKTFLQQEEQLNTQSEESSNRYLSSEINLNTPPNIHINTVIDSTMIENNRIFQINQRKVFFSRIGNFLEQFGQHLNKQYRCILQYEGLPIVIADEAIIKFFKIADINSEQYQHFYDSQETSINYGTIKNRGCFRIGTNAYFLSSQGMVKVDLTNLSTSVLGGTQQDFTTLTTDKGVIINSYGYTPYEHIPIAKGKWVLLASVVNPRSNYSIQFASRKGVSTESFTHQTNQNRSEFSAHVTVSVESPQIEGSATVTGHGKYMDEIKNMDSSLINSSEFRALTFKINSGISQFIWRYEIEGSGMFDGYTLSTPHIHITNTPNPPEDE